MNDSGTCNVFSLESSTEVNWNIKILFHRCHKHILWLTFSASPVFLWPPDLCHAQSLLWAVLWSVWYFGDLRIAGRSSLLVRSCCLCGPTPYICLSKNLIRHGKIGKTWDTLTDWKLKKCNKTYHRHVNQLVTDFTGKKDVWSQAELVPESLVAHGLPEVPQAEDCCQSHEAVRVVSCFGCHVSLFLCSSDQRQGRAVDLGATDWKKQRVMNYFSFQKVVSVRN